MPNLFVFHPHFFSLLFLPPEDILCCAVYKIPVFAVNCGGLLATGGSTFWVLYDIKSWH